MAQMTRGIPIIGFEVGSGQFEAFDEDGVATGPIVGLTFVEPDGDRHQFTLHPEGGHVLADTLHEASTTSLQMYYPKEAKLARKSRRRVVAVVVTMLILFCSFSGWADSQPTVGHGDSVVFGVLGGTQQLFAVVGLTTIGVAALRMRRRRRYKKTTLGE